MVGCDAAAVEAYFRSTWEVRHDGTLPTVTDLATHLAGAAGGLDAAVELVTNELCALGTARLAPDVSVTQTLDFLRSMPPRPE